MTGSERPVPRRRVLAALAVGGTTAGLAGCSGSSAEGPDGDDSSGDGLSEENGGDGADGGDGTAATGPGAGEEIDGTSCAEFASAELQQYGTDNTPLVFDFEYPDSWTESNSSPDRRSDRYTVILRSDIIDGRKQTFLTVAQWFDPISPAELKQAIGKNVDAYSGTEDFQMVGTLQYSGESVDIYSTPEYPEGLTSLFWLPHETADGLRYFQTLIRFGYSNAFIADADESDVDIYCDSLFEDLTELVLPSIAPNEGTTISSEL
jgi:hypothetical protein